MPSSDIRLFTTEISHRQTLSFHSPVVVVAEGRQTLRTEKKSSIRLPTDLTISGSVPVSCRFQEWPSFG
jgi:hypothetical protein